MPHALCDLTMSTSTLSVRVGLVGTGYAAKLRAETLQADPRSQLVAVVGHNPETTATFGQSYEAEALDSWEQLVERDDLDLAIVSTINRDHGAICHAALQAGKHVVVEYPLSLDASEAEELVALAQRQNKLLHVEHIELLGGLHQALKQSLEAIGTVFYARYNTINAQRPAPRRWTYQQDLFGFPLIAALSRLHRLIDLFGQVATVSCQTRYWGPEKTFYTACLCTAQLRFTSGLVAEATYGKGETFWQGHGRLDVMVRNGGVFFMGAQEVLVQAEETTPIEVGDRRGLFAKDTNMVLDHLFEGTALYVTSSASLYTLKVADAARRSAETGQTVTLDAAPSQE